MRFPGRNLTLFSTSQVTRHRRRPLRARRPGLSWVRCEDRMLLSVSLVSVDSAGTGSGNGGSDFQSPDENTPGYSPEQASNANLSADGTELVFASDASNLVASSNDTNQASNVFVRNTQTGITSLVSVTADGDSGNGPSFDPQISPNGEYVAFESQATNLTDNTGLEAGTSEAQAVGYLYVRNLQTGATTLLEQTPTGQVADGWSTGQFVFSPNSQYLAWVDTSDNVTTAPLDPDSSASSSSGWDTGPQQSPNYIYVQDLATQTTTLVSLSTGGLASGDNPSAGIGAPTTLLWSPDSQSLVFSSSATDLTANPPDSNPIPAAALPGSGSGSENLFLHNISTGTTTLLTVTQSGQLSAGDSIEAEFSPNGQSVAFISSATDLTANAADPTPLAAGSDPYNAIQANVFIRNLADNTTTLVSATPGGLQSNGTADELLFSPDGSSLAYVTDANDLTSNALDPTALPEAAELSEFGGAGPPTNLFVANLSTDTTTLVSVTPTGMMSNGTVNQAVFSPDGNLLAFTSDAGDLTNNVFESNPPTVPGAANGNANGEPADISNVFVRNLATQTTTLASPTTSGQLSNGYVINALFGPDSNSLFFTSDAVDLTSNPPDATAVEPEISNLFVRDLAAGTTSLISATTSGQLSDSTYTNFLVSPAGQTVYFDSSVDGLVNGDTNVSLYPTGLYAASAPFTTSDEIQFASWNIAADESSGQVVVTVERSGPTTSAASVNFNVEAASAHAGTDYKATAGKLTFAAGQSSGTFTIPLVPSDSFNGTRSADLVLSDPQGATLGYPSAFLSLTSTGAPSSPSSPSPPSSPSSPAPVVTKPVSPKPVTPEPGPAVLDVAAESGRRGPTGVVVTFNQALNLTSAQDVANYQVTLPGRTVRMHSGHLTATRPGRSVAIKSVTYNAATHQVALTFSKRLHRGSVYQIQIKGASGGLQGANGVPLDSPGTPNQGKDFDGTLDLGTRRS